MDWYEKYMVPNLIQNTEVWPIKLTQKVVDFHNNCIREICEVSKTEMEQDNIEQIQLQQATQDIGMETHLNLRLLQWVGRALQKNRLGKFALKGTLEEDGNRKATEPTATDERISYAINHLATALEDNEDDVTLYWPTDSASGATTRKEIITANQIATNLRNGHSTTEVTKQEQLYGKCIHCKEDVIYGIQKPNTTEVYSGIHKHFETCEGFVRKHGTAEAEYFRRQALDGQTRSKNTNEFHAQHKIKTIQLQREEDRAQYLKVENMKIEMQRAPQPTATWDIYAAHKTTWERVLKAAY